MNKENNSLLYRRLISGDSTARNELIESNIRFVVFLADLFIKNNKDLDYLRDDLVGEGNLALVESVAVLSKNHSIKNVNAFLRRSIKLSFSHLRDRDSMIGESERTIRYARANGKERTQLKRIQSNLDLGMSNSDEIDSEKMEVLIDACCDDLRDRQIVELRVAGFVDDEIGEELGMSTTTVFRKRKKIEARYDAASLSLALGA